MNCPSERTLREQIATAPHTPRVGLALSGGGARGLAHIGVLRVLERESIPVHLLAGTSMGGVIAAAYAAGLNPDFMEQEARRMASVRRLLALADPSLPRRGLFEGQKVYAYLAAHLGERTFADLRIPLALVAVDLNSGREVYLRQGRVVDAVRASVALPGVLTPVERDGQLLVDGGLLDNLPADAVRQMGADVVIAVDVTSDGQTISHLVQALYRRRYVPNGLADTIEVLWRSVAVMMAEINRHRLAEARPEVIIRPAIPPQVTVLTGFPRAAEIIAAGEQAALAALPRLRQVVEGTLPS
ncbi:MAG: patatin-like phospholipase family protein [Anaerolineae bacterium]|nr:patatin-like phospholipase family protein [Anaerolineae bacterium]